MAEKNIRSVLSLEKVVFDKIEFNRLDFESNEKFKFNIESNISHKEGTNLYRCNLVLKGEKPVEYTLEISITGFFLLRDADKQPLNLKNDLISKNTVAILMPYLRSEVTLLTAQPFVETVVLPVFNVNNMLSD